jgi:hypothetical protein
MSEEQKDVGSYLQDAAQADANGTPVSWKEVAITVYNAAMAQIKVYEDKIKELEGSSDDEVL